MALSASDGKFPVQCVCPITWCPFLLFFAMLETTVVIYVSCVVGMMKNNGEMANNGEGLGTYVLRETSVLGSQLFCSWHGITEN